MKKTLLILTLLLAFSGTVYAASINGQYKGHDIVKVTYEGTKITPSDVPAILYEGRTMVPLDMLRKVGFDVGWDQSTFTADITPAKPQKGTQTVLTLEQINALQDRIALIYVLDDNGTRIRQGSGFIINSRGLLVTAWHVADEDGFRKLEVILNGKTYYVPKGVYAFTDKYLDIYGVYLQDENSLPYLKVGNLPNDNEQLYALGYPSKIFTVYNENIKPSGYTYITLITLGPKPGTSGGALINQYGEVIGVITNGGDNGGNATNITEVMKIYQQSMNE